MGNMGNQIVNNPYSNLSKIKPFAYQDFEDTKEVDGTKSQKMVGFIKKINVDSEASGNDTSRESSPR